MTLLPKHLKDPRDRARFLASLFGGNGLSQDQQVLLVAAKLMEWETEAWNEGVKVGRGHP